MDWMRNKSIIKTNMVSEVSNTADFRSLTVETQIIFRNMCELKAPEVPKFWIRGRICGKFRKVKLQPTRRPQPTS